MNDIVDYSKRLKEETKKQRNIFILIGILILVFSFSIGFYLSYILNNDSSNRNNKDKFNTIYSILKDEWYYGIDDENIEKTLLDKAIVGMLDTQKDPYTRYLTSLGSLADSYEGLGITISKYKEYFIVTEVFSKSNIYTTSNQYGFIKGDILKEIDGNTLLNKENDYIKSLIENKESVSVKLERKGIEMTVTAFIEVYNPVTVFKDFSLSDEFAYIQISEFANDTASNLEKYLQEAKNNNYNKLILDLRDNPGGYISSVQDCADLFLESGKVVLTTKDKKENTYSYKTRDNQKYDFDKIIILINSNSASGAEALSASLDDNLDDKVELYGVKTYGKGSAQKTYYFKDGTYFHYTYALWFRPSGETINKVGVIPEVNYSESGLHVLDFVTTTLQKDDYGEDVYNLKVIMKELGYYNSDINGYFDELLESAIKQYQKDNNIEENGKLDDLTIRYLLAKSYEDKVDDYKNEVLKVINDYKN